MGNDFFNINYFEFEEDNDQNKKDEKYLINNEGENDINNLNEDSNNSIKKNPPQPKKKHKYNFYLNKSFLYTSDLEEETKYRIKQIYAIKRINLLIKITKDYLNRKNAKKNSLEDLKVLLLKNNQSLSKAKSHPVLPKNNINSAKTLNKSKSNFNKNLFSYNNIVNKEINDIEQKNIRLIRRTLYVNSNKLKKTQEGAHIINLGDNSYLIGKTSSNKKIYYSKTYFNNNDIFKAYNDVTKPKIYGIYSYYKIGCIYEGYWEENIKTDIGIEKRWDGTKYEGEYKDGKKNGIGIYIWEDSSIYFGEWLNNNINGYGVFKNNNKSKYQGEFILNKRNGYGELIKYKNGTFYFGFWSNNKKKGFGVEFSPRNQGNNKIYIGFWNGNIRHGFGIVLNKDKSKNNIYGLWKNNKNTKNFKVLKEFLEKIDAAGFSSYRPFFIKKYEEYEEIIKSMVESSEYIRNYFN